MKPDFRCGKKLTEEGQEVIGEEATNEMRDLAIIGAAQRVEHYEIAAYGTARTFAEHLGRDEVAELLQETLTEESEADEKLTEISATLLESVSAGEDRESGVSAGAPKMRRSSGS